MSDTVINVDGFTAFLPVLSRQINRRQLNRVFSNLLVPRDVQRKLITPLNKLSLRCVDFAELHPEIREFISSLEGKIEDQNPVIAIYLYLCALLAHDLEGEWDHETWVKPRIRILAKSTDLDLKIVDECFVQETIIP